MTERESDLGLSGEPLRWTGERYRAVLEQTSDGIFVFEAQTARILQSNSALRRLLGYSAGDLASMTIYDLIAHDRRSIEDNLNRALANGHRFIGERRYRRADGSHVDVEARVALMPGEESGLMCAVVHDISERKRAEERLFESERRFRQLFEQSVDAVMIHDLEGNVVDANQRACEALGYTREELLSTNISDHEMRLLSAEEHAEREKNGGTLWQRVVSSEPGTVSGIHFGEHRRKDGTTFPVEIHVGGVNYDGRRMILASMRDITERRDLEARLRYEAAHDPLTGLANRAAFLDELDRAVAAASRQRTPVAVLFIDLDDFKEVNDTFGHHYGDMVLAAVARRLKSCLRAGDMVARIGGDEFTILIEHPASEDELSRLSERLAAELKEPFPVGATDMRTTLSASIGVTVSIPDEPGGEAVLREADAAMYRAKASGKSRWEFARTDL